MSTPAVARRRTRRSAQLVVGHEVGGGDADPSSGELQQGPEQVVDIAPAGLRRAAHALHDASRRAGAGRGSGRRRRRRARGRSRPSCRGTRPAGRRRPGPRTRKWVSRHSFSSRASPSHTSAMPTPPVKPTASSTISTLRWVRWLTCWGGAAAAAGTSWTSTPAPSMSSITARSIGPGPRPSSRTRTRTPALARAHELRGQLGADLALPVDEGEEVDRVLGLVDRIEHRREDLVAVAQHVDAVALGGGDAEHALETRRTLARSSSSSVAGVDPAALVDRAHVDIAGSTVGLGARPRPSVPCLRARAAGPHGLELGGHRPAEQEGHRRSAAPRTAGRRSRPAGRRCRRTSC